MLAQPPPVPCSQAMVPNNQLPPGRIPQLTCICFLAPGSHRLRAAERPTDQLHMARRTREATRLRSKQQYVLENRLPSYIFAPQQVPCCMIQCFKEGASHRNLVMCPNSGRKKWVMKVLRGLKISKSKYVLHVVQENIKKKSGKKAFYVFLEAETRIMP